MKTFVFSVKSPKVEDFEIIIEILANQTFEDFFNSLKQAIGFNDNELSSFYLCNSVWKPLKEIVLIDMGQENNDEDKALIMSKTKINIIEDPHQKLLFVYDYLKNHEFNIELIKIKDSEPTIKYPHIVKKIGKYMETITPPIPSSILINEQIAEETPDEDEDENEEMIEVIDESTNEVDVNEDIVSKEDEMEEHFYEDMADMDFDENEEERPIDDDDILI
ncbi:MAG TPA: hypothetical protein PKJ07_02765 [Bacteroidales bacterium]|jgi:hypothetical protein|nr:plasmid pRiA4b ORF-3 family protein [Bacteroidales bacterium]HOB27052.1 hypothetical protein [Bacteroidales bacterium]HOK21436.1 hypothetical protein [Bacteroidales bacterium]HOL74806.1 hypothetical protein [Bacteroidales bacterium]HPU46786.1 hypothetical protein [Bacteroidales bacterium]